MSISTTRNCVNAILDNKLDEVSYIADQHFGFSIPVTVPGVDSEILQPKNTWKTHSEYYQAKIDLMCLFQENYNQFQAEGMTDYSEFGPQLNK
jgi:phosphoenolpyruvate carboxykinase (ATP)